MKLIKVAVEQRVIQLKRQIASQTNPMIKQILEDEGRALEKEYTELTNKK